MRIIKFRGKTPDGIWVYGQYAGEFDNSNVGGFRGALILAPYATIVEEARGFIHSIGGFEKFAEWGLF